MADRPCRVSCVFGTRPEAIKLSPVVRALRAAPERFEVRLCATGQHRDLVDPLLDFLECRPDDRLDVMRADQSLPDLTAALFTGLGPVMRRAAPDWVLVQGDTTSAMVAAMTAFYLGVPVGHVEAGLRTGRLDQPFPEEMNRVVIGRLATRHFAPTRLAEQHLLDEGVDPARIVVTGNTGIDSLHWALAQPDPPPVPGVRDAERLIFATLHRRESFGATLDGMCRAIREVAVKDAARVHFLCPVHPNPNVGRSLRTALSGLANVTLTEPLDYRATVHVLSQCYLVLTDSGGLQEEAPSLGKPVLVLRDVTERPEGITAGTARLVGTRPDAIVGALEQLLEDGNAYRRMATVANPYGDGQAAHRIVEALARADARPLPEDTAVTGQA